MRAFSILQIPFSILLLVFSQLIYAAGVTEAESHLSAIKNTESQFLLDFNGNKRTLGEYTNQGKWLVVMFWESDCFYCNKNVKNYVDLHNRRNKVDVAVLGISIDGSRRKVRALEFIKRHNVSFPNLIGENEKVSLMYARLTGGYLEAVPAYLVFNPQGQLLAGEIGAVPVNVIEKFIEENNVSGKSK